MVKTEKKLLIFGIFILYSVTFLSESRSVVSNSLLPHGLYSPWNSPGQNTEEDSLSLLQGIFPTQGSKPGLPHCRRILYQLRHKGRSRILEWVIYPFSSGFSQPRNQTRVSCIAGRFFTNWAISFPFIINIYLPFLHLELLLKSKDGNKHYK